MKDVDLMTEGVLMKEAEVSTIAKALVSSSTNTDRINYVDVTAAGVIAQNCAYLIHQEKELEKEISKKDEIRRNQLIFTKFYGKIISDEKRDIFENLKEKYLQFENWSVDKIGNGYLVYSSKTSEELIETKKDFSKNDPKLNRKIKNNSFVLPLWNLKLTDKQEIYVYTVIMILYLLLSQSGFKLLSNLVLA